VGASGVNPQEQPPARPQQQPSPTQLLPKPQCARERFTNFGSGDNKSIIKGASSIPQLGRRSRKEEEYTRRNKQNKQTNKQKGKKNNMTDRKKKQNHRRVPTARIGIIPAAAVGAARAQQGSARPSGKRCWWRGVEKWPRMRRTKCPQRARRPPRHRAAAAAANANTSEGLQRIYGRAVEIRSSRSSDRDCHEQAAKASIESSQKFRAHPVVEPLPCACIQAHRCKNQTEKTRAENSEREALLGSSLDRSIEEAASAQAKRLVRHLDRWASIDGCFRPCDRIHTPFCTYRASISQNTPSIEPASSVHVHTTTTTTKGSQIWAPRLNASSLPPPTAAAGGSLPRTPVPVPAIAAIPALRLLARSTAIRSCVEACVAAGLVAL
jgi:hypothetical protein